MIQSNNLVERHSTLQNICEAQKLITVKEARKLLGQKSKKITNKYLEELIRDAETVVTIIVREYISSINNENSDKINAKDNRI
jgi:uncharacterized membrane protein